MLEFQRSPEVFRVLLASIEWLYRLQSGARHALPDWMLGAALTGLQARAETLYPRHVLLLTRDVAYVLDAVSGLPSRERVRLKRHSRLYPLSPAHAGMDADEEAHSGTAPTASSPDASVCTSTLATPRETMESAPYRAVDGARGAGPVRFATADLHILPGALEVHDMAPPVPVGRVRWRTATTSRTRSATSLTRQRSERVLAPLGLRLERPPSVEPG